jgi:membrane protease subunit (stomatin/prohibitin family)
MGLAVKSRLTGDFRKYGIELIDFYITRITPPEAVQHMIDERAGMAAVGNLDHFLKYKAAKALGDTTGSAPGTQSGVTSGLGMGLGMGLGLGLPGMLYKVLGPDAATPERIAAHGAVNCPECYGDVPLDGRFCCHCGHQMVVIRKCAQCQKNLTVQAKFCSACGFNLQTEFHCNGCRSTLPSGTRFCFHCGEAVTR